MDFTEDFESQNQKAEEPESADFDSAEKIAGLFEEMKLLGGIMDKLISVGVIGLIILFQEDIRKFLYNLGAHQRIQALRRLFTNGEKGRDTEQLKQIIMPLVMAAINMSCQLTD